MQRFVMACANVSNRLRRRSVRFKPSRAFERRLKPQSRAGLRSSGSRLLVEIDFVFFLPLQAILWDNFVFL